MNGAVTLARRAGVRRHLLVLPTVICSVEVSRRIAEQVQGAVTVPHQHGCSQVGEDAALTARILAAMGRHPNVGAVLVVGLGCEVVDAHALAREVASAGKPTAVLTIQEAGGSVRTIAEGTRLLQELREGLPAEAVGPDDLGELTVGVLLADDGPGQLERIVPLLSRWAHLHVAQGGRVLVSGAAVLAAAFPAEVSVRCPQAQVRDKILAAGEWLAQQLRQGSYFGSGSEPSPLPERVLRIARGTLQALGDLEITGLLSPGEVPAAPGAYLVDAPLAVAPGLTALASCGAHVILQATSQGQMAGTPVAPVLTVSANPSLAPGLAADVDVVLPPEQDGDAALLVAALQRVLAGERTQGELLGIQEFAIPRRFLSL